MLSQYDPVDTGPTFERPASRATSVSTRFLKTTFAVAMLGGVFALSPFAHAADDGLGTFGAGSGFFVGKDDPLGTQNLYLGLDDGLLGPTRLDFSEGSGDGFGREPLSRPNLLFGGFRFNQHFSVELGIADLDADQRSRYTDQFGTPLAAELRGNSGDLNGMSAALTGALPLGPQVNVFGKAGLFRWELDAARSATRIDDPEAGRPSANRGYQLQLGIGSDVRLNDRFSVGAQWEYLNDLDASEPTDDHIFTGRFKVEF